MAARVATGVGGISGPGRKRPQSRGLARCRAVCGQRTGAWL